MLFCDVLDLLEPAFRVICALLCRIIYPLIATMYEIFVNISKLNITKVEKIDLIYQRVTLLLTIIMVFYVAFEVVNYVIQPDKITDKEAGASNIVKKMIIVILLIAFVPKIFELAYDLQARIINSNVISKLILGTKQDYNGDLGNNFSANVLSQFYYYPGVEDDGVKCDGPYCYDLVASNMSDLILSAKIPNFVTGINAQADSFNGYSIHYDALFSVLVGGILCWMLLLYCVDIGTRWVQLIFLQIIAPIPIIGYLAPKKDNMFNKWVKQCVAVYISLFIRIAIIYFVLLISYILAQALNGKSDIFDGISSTSDVMKRYVYIFLILGLFTFARRIPKMLEEIFPKLGGVTGSLSLKPGDRAGVARGVGMVLGSTTGLRTMVARGINTAKRNKFNKDYRDEAQGDFNRAKKAYNKFSRRNVTRNRDGTFTYKDEKGYLHTVSAAEYAKKKKDARVEYDSAKAYMENTRRRSVLGAAAAGLAGGTVRGASTGAKLNKIDNFGDVRKQMQEVEKNENAKTAAVEKWYNEGGYSTSSRILSGVEQKIGVTTTAGRMQREMQKIDSSIKSNERLIATESDVRTKLDSAKDRVTSRINDSKDNLVVFGDRDENGRFTTLKTFKVKNTDGTSRNVSVDVSGNKTTSAILNDYKVRTAQARAAADGAQKEVERLRMSAPSDEIVNAAQVRASDARARVEELRMSAPSDETVNAAQVRVSRARADVERIRTSGGSEAEIAAAETTAREAQEEANRLERSKVEFDVAETTARETQEEADRLRVSKETFEAAERKAHELSVKAQEEENLQAKMHEALRDYTITRILGELAKPEQEQNLGMFDGVAVSRVKDTLTSVLETARSEDTMSAVETEITKLGKPAEETKRLIKVYREVCLTGRTDGITSFSDLDDIQTALTNSANERTRKNVELKGSKSRLEASSYYDAGKADDTASGGKK